MALSKGKYHLDGGISSLRQIDEAPVTSHAKVPFQDLLGLSTRNIIEKKMGDKHRGSSSWVESTSAASGTLSTEKSRGH